MTKDPRAYDQFVRLRQECYDTRRGPDFISRLEALVQLDPSFMPAVSLEGEVPTDVGALPLISQLHWLWRGRRWTELESLIKARLASPELAADARWLLLYHQTKLLEKLNRPSEAAEVAPLVLAAAEKLKEWDENDGTGYVGRWPLTQMLVGRTDEAVQTTRRGIEVALAAQQVAIAWQTEITLAQIHAEAGRSRECVTLLAKLLRVPSGITVPTLRVDPKWDMVRDDAGFKALLADPKNNQPL